MKDLHTGMRSSEATTWMNFEDTHTHTFAHTHTKRKCLLGFLQPASLKGGKFDIHLNASLTRPKGSRSLAEN